MSLPILFKDEFRYFYKSAIMIILWIGLPLIGILMHLYTPKIEGMPLSLFFASIISSIGGTLASIMLAVQIIHERTANVYVLFFVRPINRNNILMSKFLAVTISVTTAVLITFLSFILIDYINYGTINALNYTFLLDSFIFSVATIILAAASGILIGVVSPSVLVAVIIIIFVTSNINSLVILVPLLINLPEPALMTLGLSAGISFVLLIISNMQFNSEE